MNALNITCTVADNINNFNYCEILLSTAKATLTKCGISNGDASIFITDDNQIQQLNKSYRGLDEVTDVLSFSNDYEGQYYGIADNNHTGRTSIEFAIASDMRQQIGEIVISLPQAQRQALGSIVSELVMLVAHGFLHLIGYDHIDEKEANEMEGLTRIIIESVNLHE
jgi:probable rRNA maturation factor